VALVAAVAQVAAAAAFVGEVVGDTSPSPVHVRVLAGGGHTVPRSFVGFSFEYPSVPTYFGVPARPNRPFVALMQGLARAQHGPPAVRIGGNSADEAWWNPAGLPGPRQMRTNLGPGWLSSLTTVESRIRLPLTLTLDLALERPANALAFVRAARAAVPPGAIHALELGNEPDLYAHRSPTAHGVLGPPRFPLLGRYPPSRYETDIAGYATALTAGLPSRPPLVAGAFAGTAWNATLPAVLHAAHGQVGSVSVHAYPLHGCHPHERRHATVARLLSPVASHDLAARVAHAIKMTGLPPARVRVGEMNSVTCGGLRGTSDTFASALWSTDTLFEMLRLGVTGVNVHSSVGAPYAPFSFTPAGATGWRAHANPLYYGLLLFAEGAPAGSRTMRVAQQDGSRLKTWATVDPRHTLRVTVINPSTSTPRTVILAARNAAPPARIIRLRAPGARARDGVTLGGQHVGADGRLHGALHSTRVAAVAGHYRLSVPAASAALITIP
jgi:hypothetical protein